MPVPTLYDCTVEFEYDEEAMDCVLQALRDRTPGRYDIDGVQVGGVFVSDSIVSVRVREDGTALHTECQQGDVSAILFDRKQYDLQASSYFETCRGLPAPSDRYECLFDGLVSRREIPACP